MGEGGDEKQKSTFKDSHHISPKIKQVTSVTTESNEKSVMLLNKYKRIMEEAVSRKDTEEIICENGKIRVSDDNSRNT